MTLQEVPYQPPKPRGKAKPQTDLQFWRSRNGPELLIILRLVGDKTLGGDVGEKFVLGIEQGILRRAAGDLSGSRFEPEEADELWDAFTETVPWFASDYLRRTGTEATPENLWYRYRDIEMNAFGDIYTDEELDAIRQLYNRAEEASVSSDPEKQEIINAY